MNHFEATEKIRKLALERGLTEQVPPEIIDGAMCEGGYDVEAFYAADDGYIRFYWDAAFQDLTEEKIFAQNGRKE